MLLLQSEFEVNYIYKSIHGYVNKKRNHILTNSEQCSLPAWLRSFEYHRWYKWLPTEAALGSSRVKFLARNCTPRLENTVDERLILHWLHEPLIQYSQTYLNCLEVFLELRKKELERIIIQQLSLAKDVVKANTLCGGYTFHHDDVDEARWKPR